MLEACALSETGKVRTTNQDFFKIVPDIGLYLLADGMGGARGGERASRVAVETVAEILCRSSQRDAAALLGAVEDANLRVLHEASSDARYEGMGTTLVAALETRENDLAIASVGDSRAYILDQGRLRVITEDQTWIQEIGRGLGLDESSLRSHPMRHVLTMAVGVGTALRVRYYAVSLQTDSIIMLSSDGLHGVVGEEEIEDILQSNGKSLGEQCSELVAAAHAAGSPDNVTVLLIRRAS